MLSNESDQCQAARAWVREYATAMLCEESVDELVVRWNGQLIEELPELGSDPGVRRDLDASTRDAVRMFLDMLSKDAHELLEVPVGAVGLARTLAQRQYDVGLLLRLYRTGQRVFWVEVMRIVRAEITDAELQMAVLELLWERVSRLLEQHIDALVTVHTEETERRLRGSVARRLETVHAILRGEALEIDTACKRLGHNLHRHQTGLVLWATDAVTDADPSSRLEGLACELATAVGTVSPLNVQAGSRVVWSWLASGSEPELARIAAVVERRGPGLRAAVGIPAPGLAGFRDSHRQAIRAQTVAVRSARDELVTWYREVELASCLPPDSEAVRALVARQLGGLARRDATAARLRETVRAYLGAGANARAAADALGVHKNTVLYRLRQVEPVLGERPERRGLPLELALLVHETYGDAALPADVDGRGR
ncbi:helix-turn-helix domain-containing protein [Haloechinothrix sp. LS1_15]|uniref:PucR family transcriptional regulator n=1 Tax=Haloechinothrix sp. LS1_15 TaxID=2652248 RepID=UPI00294799BE|nr:helix-turn-helix domain-containing protein [Haloechinothrix sp. LS1_15]MDV6013074.1 hypothetical protein [Haloechinothrix sp. LS1_15]